MLQIVHLCIHMCIFSLSDNGLTYRGSFIAVVFVVVITPLLLRDGRTVRTAIQVHAVNLIEIRLGEDGSPFRTSHE